MKITIYAKVEFVATHCWPDCNIAEVAYLKNEHRHKFGIKAYKEVTHNNRDIEFILLGNKIRKYLFREYPNNKLGSKSCEMLAEELISSFKLNKCEVSEDWENGAIVEI